MISHLVRRCASTGLRAPLAHALWSEGGVGGSQVAASTWTEAWLGAGAPAAVQRLWARPPQAVASPGLDSRLGVAQPAAAQHVYRLFSTSTPQQPGTGAASAAPETPAAPGVAAEDAPGGASAAAAADSETVAEEAVAEVAELKATLAEKELQVQELAEQVAKLTDMWKRSLADMENLRARTSMQLEQTQKFAVQGFAKSMLDVADNLQRAVESVPKDVLDDAATLELEQANKLLRSFFNGVQLTESILQQALKQNGVAMFDPLGAKFDPNLHNALFEVPDASREPGTVAIVTKRGYMIKERVLRPAEVGVARAAPAE